LGDGYLQHFVMQRNCIVEVKTTCKSPSVKPTEKILDLEKILVIRAIQSALDSGLIANHIDFVNFYVSLKAKPLAILVGPKQQGKNILVECFAKNLIQGEMHNQFQSMPGHPWWIERNKNQASFWNIHSQFNAEKLHIVTENASRSKNGRHLFIACLNKISPAEVNRFFLEIARQLQVGRIIYLQKAFIPYPFIYPNNLLVIGTIDTPSFHWYDNRLLSHTSIIHWQALRKTGEKRQYPIIKELVIDSEEEFFRSRIRSTGSAYLKIQHILGDQSQALKSILEVESILLKHGLTFSTRQVTGEAIIYLANAWTSSYAGLFDDSKVKNLQIALDLAIAQIVLPRGWELIRKSASFRSTLCKALDGHFPRSRNFVKRVESVV
jgi:hypothetical protein